MSQAFNLLGEPLPANHGRPGRDAHVPCPEIASKIKWLLVSGMTLARVSEQVGLSAPTIRKHYFPSVKAGRAEAIEEAKGEVVLKLVEQMNKGRIGAMQELMKIINGAALGVMPGTLQKKKEPKKKPIGLKERRAEAASKPGPGWGARLGSDTLN